MGEKTPCISYHALTGHIVPSTMKLAGTINGRPVVVLIDGGSTNNFIQTKLAEHLNLPVQPLPHLRVTVGNGDSLNCAGTCLQVPLRLDDATFNVDLMLLPIYGADLVLGVQWMASLGPIIFDYNNLWMEFTMGDTRIQFQGVRQPAFNYITTSGLMKQNPLGDPIQYFHLVMETHPLQPTPNISPDVPLPIATALQGLLHQFAPVFSTPTALPPPREIDHRIRIHPPDIDKTAFRTHDGHFEFIVMPFGLSNAPSTFQALMNAIFRGVLRRFVLVFFDDILVYSPSWDQHLEHLHTVLTILQNHHLFAKLTKCAFGCTELLYLGHRISGQGISVDKDKIAVIREWPVPSSIKALRVFLGLAGYYRRFVPHYSTLTAPLTSLLRKYAFVWASEATSAFQQARQALMPTSLRSQLQLESTMFFTSLT